MQCIKKNTYLENMVRNMIESNLLKVEGANYETSIFHALPSSCNVHDNLQHIRLYSFATDSLFLLLGFPFGFLFVIQFPLFRVTKVHLSNSLRVQVSTTNCLAKFPSYCFLHSTNNVDGQHINMQRLHFFKCRGTYRHYM